MQNIPLTRGLFAIVDDQDAHWSSLKWYAAPAKNGFYAAHKFTRNDTTFLHSLILPVAAGLEVDHRNGNTLDCRRANLRACSHAQNLYNRRRYSNNTSGFKGVWFDRTRQRWQTMVTKDGKRTCIGRFATAKEAARAYDAAARIVHGEFARLNFP